MDHARGLLRLLRAHNSLRRVSLRPPAHLYKLKQSLLAELERNVTLQLQASTNLLRSMPDKNHFWDRLSMEFRRALTLEKTMSLVLAKASPNSHVAPKDEQAAFSDAAKSMTRRLAPRTRSITSPTIFSASCCRKRIHSTPSASPCACRKACRTCARNTGSPSNSTAHNYPDHVKSSHELEDIVKSLLPEEKEWEAPAEAPVAG